MRNSTINPKTAEVFGAMDYFEIADQMRSIANRQSLLLNGLDETTAKILKARIDQYDMLAQTAKEFRDDKWKSDYVDNFSRHLVGIRKTGWTDKLPDKLEG